jgi:tRNA (adenine57-N1/adenine58-N1)-methyltransferase catalytic subunit
MPEPSSPAPAPASAPRSPPHFLQPGRRTVPGDLAIILLSRDTYEPITLEASTGAVDGYAEGAVLNTRFGSFPHSTFLDIPWGSQVRASKVDTGSRGRKRRIEEVLSSIQAAAAAASGTPAGDETPTTTTPNTPSGRENNDDETSKAVKKAVTSASGFVHILRPTPELWTSSLPHRTQVVYIPDYSYILNRIRARPGTRLIEAGAGSGSFTHASVRAVYNGMKTSPSDVKGKVFSFEFNEARFRKMQEEIHEHDLDELVEIRHRDVYNDGFLADGESPNATAIFLDLPAPWKALRHLSRRQLPSETTGGKEDPSWVSPLDPTKTVHICTFSPCIEQVTQTVDELRKLGWVDIQMVEVSNKRYNIVRDRVGLNLPKEKGFNPTPANVDEAVSRLKELTKRAQEFQESQNNPKPTAADEQQMDIDSNREDQQKALAGDTSGNAATNDEAEDKLWMHGRIVHRPEAEIKTHTSYLTFAILPQEWSEEDEAAAFAKWPCGKESRTIGNIDKAARKQEKREQMASKKKKQKR